MRYLTAPIRRVSHYRARWSHAVCLQTPRARIEQLIWISKSDLTSDLVHRLDDGHGLFERHHRAFEKPNVDAALDFEDLEADSVTHPTEVEILPAGGAAEPE